MTCKYCGSPLEGDAKFCNTCGARVEEQQSAPVAVNPPVEQPYTPPVQQPMQTPPPVAPNPYLQQPYTPPVAPQYPVPTQQPGESMATAAQIMGIISLFCMGGIVAILAIIFGCVAKNQGYQGGKATTGIVCGIISLILGVLFYVVYFAILGTGMAL